MTTLEKHRSIFKLISIFRLFNVLRLCELFCMKRGNGSQILEKRTKKITIWRTKGGCTPLFSQAVYFLKWNQYNDEFVKPSTEPSVVWDCRFQCKIVMLTIKSQFFCNIQDLKNSVFFCRCFILIYLIKTSTNKNILLNLVWSKILTPITIHGDLQNSFTYCKTILSCSLVSM